MLWYWAKRDFPTKPKEMTMQYKHLLTVVMAGNIACTALGGAVMAYASNNEKPRDDRASFAIARINVAQAIAPAEQPLKTEKSPPGDIPDNQVFIHYASPLGFNLKVPEGWARQDIPGGSGFADKYGRITVTQTTAATEPDLNIAKNTLVPELTQSGHAVTVTKVRSVKLPAGQAILISYQSNSDPNPVTNKAIRLENDRYYFWKGGKLVTLNFSAPAGADNADQWDLMAESFGWR
jgi:hypothetical protein